MGGGSGRYSDIPNGENEEEAAYHNHANGAPTLLAATKLQGKLDREPIK